MRGRPIGSSNQPDSAYRDAVVKRAATLRRWVHENGWLWTSVNLVRLGLLRASELVARSQMNIERRRFILGSETASAVANTIADNRRKWGSWDWSRHGEEWTEHVFELRGLEPGAWKA